jgi:two-component system response regulator RegA
VQGVRLGAASYLTKPVDAEQIVAALEAPETGSGAAAPPVAQPLARVEWVQRVLADCGGNVSYAARVLGIHRRSLQRKLLKYPVAENS